MYSCVFAPLFLQNSYSLSQNSWTTLLSSWPPKVGANRSPFIYHFSRKGTPFYTVYWQMAPLSHTLSVRTLHPL